MTGESRSTHTSAFIDREWLALWISLALVCAGAGAISLDAHRRGGGTDAAAPRGGAYWRPA